VSCPRKGALGESIAWKKCLDMHEETPGSCGSCDKHSTALQHILQRADRPLSPDREKARARAQARRKEVAAAQRDVESTESPETP